MRILCFFDDECPITLDQQYGPNHYGVHTPVIGSGWGWPQYVNSLFFDFSGNFAFDNLIYINGRASADSAGGVITFAHELQHFVQFGFRKKLWLANTLIYAALLEGPPTTVKPWDLPHETEAIRMSKFVAEAVLGADVVAAHCERKIATGNDREKWEFFQQLSLKVPFDLRAETLAWVERYKGQLPEQEEIDFSTPSWWAD